jgi:hypothetical protein
VPVCPDDGYPMIPVRDTGPGGLAWGCSNPWHPSLPGPCPACGDQGRPRSSHVGGTAVACCTACRHRWQPSTNS